MLCWSLILTKIINSIFLIIHASKSQAALKKTLPLALHLPFFQSARVYVLFKNENIRRKKDLDIIKNGKRQQHIINIHGITSHTEKTYTRPQPQLCNSLLMDLDLDVASTISMSY